MKAIVAGRRVVGLLFLFLSAVTSLFVPHISHSAKKDARRLVPADAKTAARINAGYGQLPIRFEANQGQFDRALNFVARGGGYSLALKSDEAWVQLRTAENQAPAQERAAVSETKVSQLKLRLANANRNARSIGLDPLEARSNYFLGRNQKAWRTNVANFARVKYEAVYPGIDLIWYGNQQQLEHDFLVAPGADPKRIRLEFTGAQKVTRNAQGDLTLRLDGGELRLLKPIAWQEGTGKRRTIFCEYRLRDDGQVEFELGDYDHGQTLVIDPILLYSTFIGGGGNETGRGIAVDQDGSVYVVGETFSADFPILNPIQSKPATNFSADAFILKLNPAGSALVYATYLGGDFTEIAYSAAVDAERNLYLTGYTFSNNFPTTANALQKEYRGNGDAFVAKLNPTGSALVYSSYLGGEDFDIAACIAVNAAGEAFVSGYSDSRNLPANGFQKTKNGNSVYKSEDRAGQWRSNDNGLSARIVYQFALDPNDSRILYAATSSGIFKSTDGGGAWQKTGFPSATQAVAIDPTNSQTLFAAIEGGVYKSTDGGATWQQKQTGLTEFLYYSVLIDRQTPATVYVGSSRGVFKSTNGGENWTPANTGFNQPTPFPQPPSVRIDYLVADAASPQIIYAGTTQGVFKTLNGAGQWFAANNGLGSFPGTIRALVADPATPGTLYAALGSITSSIFKSTDGGNSWTPSGPNSTLGTVPFPTIVASLAIDPTTTTTLYAGTQIEGVFKSTDGGATWNLSSNGLKNNYVRALAVDRGNPATVYAGILGGPDGFVAKLNAAGNGLAYLTYLGGTESDFAVGLAIDKDGNAYVTGETNSSEFPTANALQAARSGFASDAFVTKLDPNGATLLYSTYLGGINTDSAEKIAVDAAGSAYVTGTTQSSNFPLRNAAQPTFGGFSSDAFVAKLNPAGSALEYSTFFGGQSTDVGRAIAVDGNGNAVIAGATTSPDFPTLDSVLPNPKLSTDADAFVVRLDAGGAVSYSTLLGGFSNDQAYGIAVDAARNVYVTGQTSSRDFPVVESVQPYRAGFDVFITKLGFESDLTIAMTALRNPVLAGSSLRYAMTVTNQGPSPATGITVTDVLPANVGFVSATASQGTCANNAGTLTCNIGKLAAQASATITLTVTPMAAGTLANTARVQGNEPDKFPNNNQATAQIRVSALPSIAGRITDAGGKGVPGVVVRLTASNNQPPLSQQTDAGGFYQFSELAAGGNYVITPAHNAFSFEPASASFENLTADRDADFKVTTCTYAIAPVSQSFEAGGGAGSIAVTATVRCAWTATSNADWVRITAGANGAGNGEVRFTVEPTTIARSARITVAGRNFAVYQSVTSVSLCAMPSLRFSNYYLGDTSGQGFEPKVITADFNGDGRTDLFVLDRLTNSAGNRTLTILVATARGGFVSVESLRLPGAVQTFEVADFNGDRSPDVAIINLGNVEIRLNNGAGGLREPVNYPFNSSQTSVDAIAAVDFNRDGRTDLAILSSPTTSSSSPSTLRILLNNGSGGLLPPLSVALGTQRLLGIADVTGDGNPDLLTWIETFSNGVSTRTLRLYPGDGLGSLNPPVETRVTFAPNQTAFGDVNGDGNLDVVFSLNTSVTNPTSNVLILTTGDGGGRFGAAVNLPLPEDGRTSLGKPLLADLNNDAKPDILLPAQNQLFFFAGDGAGRMAAGIRIVDNLPLSDLLAADLNGDGRLDLAGLSSTFSTGNSLAVMTNRCGAAPVIYGKVTDGTSPVGVGGVTIKLRGPGQTVPETVTDSGGNYSFSSDLLPNASYTVVPESQFYRFTPQTQTVTEVTTDKAANFATARTARAVSAASFRGDAIAPESIVSVFGEAMTTGTAMATALPLPLQLGGVSARIRDAAGAERPLRLFFVSPRQINLLMPPELVMGAAQLTITQTTSTQYPIVTVVAVNVEPVAPGLFSADGSGTGPASGFVVRLRDDGTQSFEPLARFDAATQRFVAVPIEVGNPLEQVYLALFATGVRNRSALTAASVTAGGAALPALYAGPAEGLFGVDQLNVLLPRTLAGRGNIEVGVRVDGKTSNTVVINVK